MSIIELIALLLSLQAQPEPVAFPEPRPVLVHKV